MNTDSVVDALKWFAGAVGSGFVGWCISRVLDPPRKPPSGLDIEMKEASYQHAPVSSGMTITQVNNYVHARTYERSRTSDQDAASLIAAFVFAMVVAALAGIVFYDTLAVHVVRFFVAATGFASLFLGLRILVSPVALPNSWMFRVVVMMVICVMLWISSGYVEDSVIATIVRAKSQGYTNAGVPNFIKLLGLKSTFDLVHVALAIVTAVSASLMAIVAQIHLLLSAHAAARLSFKKGHWRESDLGDHDDWRIRLLASMRNWSGLRTFIPMIMMTLLCFGIASQWPLQLFSR